MSDIGLTEKHMNEFIIYYIPYPIKLGNSQWVCLITDGTRQTDICANVSQFSVHLFASQPCAGTAWQISCCSPSRTSVNICAKRSEPCRIKNNHYIKHATSYQQFIVFHSAAEARHCSTQHVLLFRVPLTQRP